MTEERREKGRFYDEFREDTVKTQAAKKLIDTAETIGVLDRMWLVLSRHYSKIAGVAANSPRRVERRNEQWRDQEKGTVSLDPTSTDGSGESDSLDRMGDKLWSHFQQKSKPKKR